MPFIEQLLYGQSHADEATGRQELAHSAGLGAEVAAEVHAICEAWGQPPELGLQHPVLLCQPLQATMPSMRGRLYAVICVAAVEPPLFHAVVVTDAIYSSFGRNPYALAQVVKFVSEWTGSQGMDRVEIDVEAARTLVEPGAGPEDVGLVDEAVLQYILAGVLQLPLEQALRPSDRAMALIIACLPDKSRKELKFASFTTAQINAYDIAGLETEGATFAGWQRLMMARIDTGVTTEQQEYKDLIAGFLAQNDMVGLARVSSRHNFLPAPNPHQVVATRPSIETPVPAPAPAPVTPAATSFGPSAVATPAAGPPGAASLGHTIRPAISPSRINAPRVPIPEHGLDPAAGPAKPRRSTRNRSRVRTPFTSGHRGTGGRFLRTISVVLILFVAGWVGTMYLDGKNLAESLEWAGLPGMDGGTENVEHGGTLLEVVDVGRVYERALKHTGGKGFGLNASGDKAREKALGRLQTDALDPLLEQVILFVKLTDEGIQPSRRQDREVDRLDALAKQGAVLAKEMARLELAWFSLTTSINWADLGRLSDAQVAARSDSLSRAEKGALSDVRLAMGTEKIQEGLLLSGRHMDGMASVVRLFQAPQWSANWEKKLARAAADVSPSAGRTTRAYRNSAFALIRLKKAEHAAENQDLPFAGHYEADQWPSSQVKAILPLLRKEVGRFSDQNAPALLGATLSLYTSLEKPEKTIAAFQASSVQWKRLQDNAAVRFDPALYGNFLERLRYEAAGRALTMSQDPTEIPDHLYDDEDCQAVVAFADSLTVLTGVDQWQAMAVAAQEPFLGRWADHLAGNLQARLAHLQQDFAMVWAECRSQAVSIQSQAKAGYDWSDNWQKLYALAHDAGDKYAETLGEDPAQQARFDYLDELVEALEAQRPLHIERVTVRLDQDVLSEPTSVQLEFRTPVRGGVWTSEPFIVGPSAPAGTGWVGTAFLDWNISLSPRHQMTARIVLTDEPGSVLDVSFPSLAEGTGPAAMVRPWRSEQGSLSFRTDLEQYWSAMEIPELGLVF